MKKLINLFQTILCVMLVLASTHTAQAFPPLPSSIYGSVKLAGAYVPVGTEVSAWIGGVRYATTHTILYQGMSVFSMDVPGDDSSTPGIIEGGKNNDTIVFMIADVTANESGAWHSGTNVSLDLSGAASQTVEYPMYFPMLTQAP